MKRNNWAEDFTPINMADKNDFSKSAISLSVYEKLTELENAEKRKGQITMEKTTKRRIKPFIIAAAISASAMISMISVNAATDGAVTKTLDKTAKKITCYINGEEVDATVTNVSETDNEVIYQFDNNNSDGESDTGLACYIYYEDEGEVVEEYEFNANEYENDEISISVEEDTEDPDEE